MRRLVGIVVVAVAACGGGTAADAPPAPTIDAPTIDAPVDAPVVPGIDAVVATCTPVTGTTVALRHVVDLDDFAVLVTSPPGDRRAFVVERGGVIRILVDDALVATPFLDLADISGGPVVSGAELGLLGLAFHPQYATNRRFYVFYTTIHADDGELYDELAEYRTSAADPDVADPTTARVLLSIPDYAANHQGGMIEFGPDGLLYISVGDGGGNGDPQRTAQDLNRLLGKMLRIDIDQQTGGREYGIPPANPFAAGGGAPEVLMYGFRNPWRWSFDRATNDIYIGDVGHHCVEEVDVIPFADVAAADFGWSDCEGTRDQYGTGCAAPTQPNRHPPVYQQVRANPTFACGGTSMWNAVIGGQVYRGSCYPDLVGRYFFADSRSGELWSFVYAGGQATDIVQHPLPALTSRVSSIHADALGELYLTRDGSLYRIVVED
jgi:glucose/arabinose dehydrogenase